MMNWYGGGGWAPLMWGGMGLFWILLIGLIVFLVVRLLPGPGASNSAASGPTPGQPESAEQILDRLFATGEIDEQAYRARRVALSEMRKQS
jgi:putative membrane protein